MRFLKVIGVVLFIVFVARFFIGGTVGEEDLGKIAEKKVKQQVKEDPEIDKMKIVHTFVYNKKHIINATVSGLPQDEADLIEVEVETRQTSKNGIETDENYVFPFYQLEGEKEWKFAREIKAPPSHGTAVYKLEDL